ncbi:MAG TPA: RNA-protein complex protein Nop10 [Thermoplasmata archaeon]|nr:RNA-protein complex protein Nop10 [Thermoplasmata archaeon]
MTSSILRVCRACDRYTFREKCPQCAGPTRTPHPARFDPGDRYGKYRRMLLESLESAPARGK